MDEEIIEALYENPFHELVCDSCISEPQRGSKEEFVFLDSFESRDNFSEEALSNIPHIYDKNAAHKKIQECSVLFHDVDDNEESIKQIVAFHLRRINQMKNFMR
jgi:hypothetical protein